MSVPACSPALIFLRAVCAKVNSMAITKIKNGTPLGSKHLCKTCRWGQCISGYRESELLVICNYTSPLLKIPFTVYECSQFDDANKPSWDQMQKLAIEVRPATRLSKTAGFSVKLPLTPITTTEDEDVEEVASVL